jgi:hypothetical protein
MHSYYTEIPLRSFDAIVKNGYLSEVLMALLVDPLEAEDVADSVKSRTMTAIYLEVNGHTVSAPIGLADFQNLPSKDAFEKLKITLSQWVMTTKRASGALRELTMWDRRFGVWCACQVAREALRFIPRSEPRPLRAIKTAEAWVRGTATEDQADTAAQGAEAYAEIAENEYGDYLVFEASSAASSASYTVVGYDFAGDAAAGSASAFAYSAQASDPDVDWDEVREAELIRLREVVAAACLTFPG